METQANESNEKTQGNTLTVVETNKPQTLQEKYDDLMEIFGTEKNLREELSEWFRYFAEHGYSFKKQDKNNYVFRYSRVIEFFTGNETTEEN
jgi:hypothetical protein